MLLNINTAIMKRHEMASSVFLLVIPTLKHAKQNKANSKSDDKGHTVVYLEN